MQICVCVCSIGPGLGGWDESFKQEQGVDVCACVD